ncbi:MAG TPA: acyltransferase [Solimonas sp.]|nr:acyltransferase [Solimonas sp.]
MLSILLPGFLVGAITFVLMLANLIGAFLLLAPFSVLKLIPYPPWQRGCSRIVVFIASQWAAIDRVIYRLLHPMQWELDFRVQPQAHTSYLLLCNHQSWVDILLLCDVFHRHTPFPRFFLKHQLKYMPIIGQACWAMDFPFMKRHSREAVAANPALRSEDLDATRRACEIFRRQPVTVVNFVEGTRFSQAKRVALESPYRHLLRPKAAGLSFALNAMGEQFAGIIDVTVAYQPTDKPVLWAWLCGEQDNLAVHIDVLPVPQELVHGDYEQDPEFRARFQAWVNGIWARKDARLERMLGTRPAMQQRPAHPV